MKNIIKYTASYLLGIMTMILVISYTGDIDNL